MGTSHIFQKRHFDSLKSAQRTLHDLLPLIDKAEGCGIECQEFRNVAEELSRRLVSLEEKFMSPPPNR